MKKLTDDEKTLLDVLIIDGDLTLPSLERQGVSYNRIAKMIKNGDIVRIKNGFFVSSDYSLLAIYADQLKEEGKINKAERCRRVYEENCDQNIARMMKIVTTLSQMASLSTKQLLDAGLSSQEINVLYNRGLIRRKSDYYAVNSDFPKDLLPKEKSDTAEDRKSTAPVALPEYSQEKRDQYLQMLYSLIGKKVLFYKANLTKEGIPVTELMLQGVFKKNPKQKMLTLNEVSGLIDFADGLSFDGKIDEALNCYLYALGIDPSSDLIIKIAVTYIIKNDLEKACKYVRMINEDLSKRSIYNTLMYLLSFLSDLKIFEIGATKNFTLSDLIDVSVADINFEKNFKQLILAQKFKSARFLLQSKNIKGEDAYLRAVDSLLEKNILRQREISQQIINFIDGEKYKELFSLLGQENSIHRLSFSQNLYLLIVTDIVEKIEEDMTPIVCTPQNDTLYELIRTKNYKRAYLKCLTLSSKKGVSPEKNYLGKLLKKASQLLPEPEPIAPEKTGPEKTFEKTNYSMAETFKRFFYYLRSGNKIGAIAIANRVLESRGLSEFSYLIQAMVEQSIIEKDQSFIKAVGTLRKLERGSIFIDPVHKIIDVDMLINDINTFLGDLIFGPVRHIIKTIKEVQKHGHSPYTDKEMEKILLTIETRLHEREKKYKV